MLLSPAQARHLFALALQHRFAVLAVNADSPAAVLDVLEAARELDAPVLIETSLWQLEGRSFGAGDATLGLARYLADLATLAGSPRYAPIPVGLHTDHIKGPATLPLLRHAIAGLPIGSGYPASCLSPSSISLDSSALSEDQNIAAIRELCATAATTGRDLTLEMEAGVDDGVTPLDTADRLLSPVEASHPGFLALWAPGVGTRHGLGTGGYPTFSPDAIAAHQARASAICGRPVGIALHGSSGLPPEQLSAAVDAGVAKVNWSSESLLIRSQAARDFFSSHTQELTPGHARWKATAMDNALQSFISTRYLPAVRDRLTLLRSSGKAALFRAAPAPAA